MGDRQDAPADRAAHRGLDRATRFALAHAGRVRILVLRGCVDSTSAVVKVFAAHASHLSPHPIVLLRWASRLAVCSDVQ